MERVKLVHAIDLEKFRCLADFVLDRSANTGILKAAYDLLALIHEQKAAPRVPDQPILCDLCLVRERLSRDDDGISFCKECMEVWRGSWKPIDDEVE